MKSLSTLVGVQVLGAAISLVAMIFIAANLQEDEFGIYAWCVALSGLFSLVFQLGLPTTILKTAGSSGGERGGDIEGVAGVCAVYFSASFITFAICLVNHVFGGSIYVWILPISASAAFCLVLEAGFRSKGKPVEGGFFVNFCRPFAFLLMVFFVDGLFKIDARSVVISYAASFLVAGILFSVRFVSLFKKQLYSIALIKPNFDHFQLTFVRSVASHLPLSLAGFFLAPGIYSYFALAQRLTGPMKFGISATRGYSIPKIRTSIRKEDSRDALAKFRQSQKFSFFTSLILGLLVLAAVTVLVFGPGGFLGHYEDRFFLFALIFASMVSQLIFAAGGPVQLFCIMLGEEPETKKINFLLLLIFFGMLLLSGWLGSVYAFALSVALYALGTVTLLLSLSEKSVKRRIKYRAKS
jgi:O-antigen/teichoic acid export membrane protein